MSLRVAALLGGCVLAGTVKVAIGLAGIDGPAPQEAPAGFKPQLQWCAEREQRRCRAPGGYLCTRSAGI